MVAGRWIAFAGIDGAGKTTQAKLLHKFLNKEHKSQILTQFSTIVGEKIKKILEMDETHSPEIRALLFASLNYYNYNLVEKYLAKNDFVITDRSFYCAIAYLSPQNLPSTWIETIYQRIPKPDISILLDIPVEYAIKRKKSDKLMPSSKITFLENVHQEYLQLSKKGYLNRVNALEKPNNITKAIIEIIFEREKNGQCNNNRIF